MGLRLGFYAVIVMVVLLATAGPGWFSQRDGTSGSTAIAAPLSDRCPPGHECGGDGGRFRDRFHDRFHDRHDDEDNGNDDEDNGNKDNGNGNGNGNGNNNNNGNDNGNNDNDDNDNNHDEDNQNDGGGGGQVALSQDNGCAQAFTSKAFTSSSGRISVQVFSTMSTNVRFSFADPIDAATVPATPGQKVDALLFRVSADNCGGGNLGSLPAEVNLGVRYSPVAANYKLAWLDPADNTWKPLPKQAADPGANYISATIMNTGYFVVYQ